MRTPLDAIITEKSLRFVSGSGNAWMTDALIDEAEANGGKMDIKNVCAKVSTKLSDEIDQICALLNISKRRFLEAAFIEAVDKANQIMEQEGVWDYLEQNHSVKVDSTSTEQGAL